MIADTEALRALDQDDLIALNEGVMHAEMMEAGKVQMDTTDARLLIEAARELIRLRAEVERMRWQPIDENYSVSSTGVVKHKNGNLLGQWKNDQGYMLVRLSSPRRMERVHRLVASAFVRNPRGLNTVNHIDSDRSNNNAANLEWCTQSENLQHASNLGRMQRDFWAGKRSPNAGLTDDEVRSMRSDYDAGGTSFKKLADKFGVSKRCVGRVVNREAYRDVQ